MSLSTTLSNALSGLGVASRAAEVVSNNVSNSTSENYARRELSLSTRMIGQNGSGVRVDGVVRIVDESVLRERRLAAAAVGELSVTAEFASDFLDSIGQPGAAFSLTALTSGLESAFLEATSRPESESRLQSVLSAAQSLATKLNATSDFIQSARQEADRAISQEVGLLNTRLEQIAELNSQILRAWASDEEYPALLDSRQKLIDEVSEVIPIRQLPRDNDTVALYSLNGALLVDSRSAQFEFTNSGVITPEMNLGDGSLSGISVDGTPISMTGAQSPLAGGRLSGLFAVRDVLAPSAQAEVDAFAQGLVTRFEDPTLDTTLTIGDPGIFTDAGSSFDASVVVGLAQRISINPQLDPTQGGEIWRIRDGIGAAAQGSVGDATLLTDQLDRLREAIAPVGGSFSSTERTVFNFAADIASFAGQNTLVSNDSLTFRQTQLSVLNDELLADGVDTDQELQKLLLIERAYAANAKVIQTADELMQLLIGL